MILTTEHNYKKANKNLVCLGLGSDEIALTSYHTTNKHFMATKRTHNLIEQPCFIIHTVQNNCQNTLVPFNSVVVLIKVLWNLSLRIYKLHDLNLHLPLGLALQHSFRKSHDAKMNMLSQNCRWKQNGMCVVKHTGIITKLYLLQVTTY